MRALLSDRRGIAALEFVISLPFVMILFFGCWEIYGFARAIGLVERAAFTVGDLTARKVVLKDSMSLSDANNIGVMLQVASEVASPLVLNDDASTVILSAVREVGGVPTVVWQRATNGKNPSRVGAQGMAAALPPDLAGEADKTIIAAEVFYTYVPAAWSGHLTAGSPLSQSFYEAAYTRPRYADLDTLQ